MRTVYGALLEEMSYDRFQVMEKRYALSSFKKRALVLQALVAR